MRLIYIFKTLSHILKYLGIVVIVPIIITIIDNSLKDAVPFLVAFGISEFVALLFWFFSRELKTFNDIKKSEALFSVAVTWVAFGLVGAIPYMFYNLSFVDSLFESVSGITTTGSTIFTDFSLYPRALFFWRSFSQWIGGLGIIVLFVAILPQFAVAGRQLFFAESPGPTEDKITPRITSTAKYLWLIYIILTVVEIMLLTFFGMPIYDSICNSFSTMAGGGFSPNSMSIAGYNSAILTWIVTIFMFLAGGNFALQYYFFIRGKIKPLIKNEEYRAYFFFIFFLSIGLSLSLIFKDKMSIFNGFTHGFFQIASIMTTTGFASIDFEKWSVASKVILFIPLLIGGSAGSAAGGVKVIRILFVFKYMKREILKVLHPNVVRPVSIDKNIVPNDITRQMVSFVQIYFFIFAISAITVTIIENSFVVGITGSITTIGNTGPGYGVLGPMGGFSSLHTVSKIIFIINMLIGRLEIIPFFVLIFPSAWQLRYR